MKLIQKMKEMGFVEGDEEGVYLYNFEYHNQDVKLHTAIEVKIYAAIKVSISDRYLHTNLFVKEAEYKNRRFEVKRYYHIYQPEYRSVRYHNKLAEYLEELINEKESLVRNSMSEIMRDVKQNYANLLIKDVSEIFSEVDDLDWNWYDKSIVITFRSNNLRFISKVKSDKQIYIPINEFAELLHEHPKAKEAFAKIKEAKKLFDNIMKEIIILKSI